MGRPMAFLGNLRNVVIASFVLAILLVGIYCSLQGFDGPTFELFTALAARDLRRDVDRHPLVLQFRRRSRRAQDAGRAYRAASPTTSPRRRCSGFATERWARSCSASSWPAGKLSGPGL